MLAECMCSIQGAAKYSMANCSENNVIHEANTSPIEIIRKIRAATGREVRLSDLHVDDNEWDSGRGLGWR